MRHFFIFSLLIFSVACTKSGVGKDSSSADGKSLGALGGSNSGNGEYYGGKPVPGTYIRKVPATKCASSPEILGQVVVTDTEATEKILDTKTCSVKTNVVQFNNLTYANYFTGRVGHLEGIYTKSTPENAGTIEEAWCRGISSTTNQGFDVVIRADYKNNVFQAFVVSAKADRNGQIIRTEHPPITVEDRRWDPGQRVRYRVEEKFEIDIQTSLLNPWAGTMRAEFKYDTNGFDAEQWLDCRLGGAADFGAQ